MIPIPSVVMTSVGIYHEHARFLHFNSKYDVNNLQSTKIYGLNRGWTITILTLGLPSGTIIFSPSCRKKEPYCYKISALRPNAVPWFTCELVLESDCYLTLIF